MSDIDTKMISVSLQCGAWYAEPEDYHLYLHVVSDGDKRSLVTTVAQNEREARGAILSVDRSKKILFTISLFDLLEFTRRNEEDALNEEEDE